MAVGPGQADDPGPRCQGHSGSSAPGAAVQGGSCILVLSTETDGVESIVYTASMSVTSHNTDMGTWNI